MKPFTALAAVLLALIAAVQLVRLVFRWEVTVHGVIVPLWPSGLAVLIAGGLAVMLWREMRR